MALILDVATSPVRCGDLAAKLAGFSATPAEKINLLIMELVAHRVLLSALRTPSTITDPLGHLPTEPFRATCWVLTVAGAGMI